MKKRTIKYLKRKKTQSSTFLNICPVTGGYCFNPVCIMGCIED